MATSPDNVHGTERSRAALAAYCRRQDLIKLARRVALVTLVLMFLALVVLVVVRR